VADDSAGGDGSRNAVSRERFTINALDGLTGGGDSSILIATNFQTQPGGAGLIGVTRIFRHRRFIFSL
jgi:hypothetical protein